MSQTQDSHAVIGFYFLGKKSIVDHIYNHGFLGNFYLSPVTIRPPNHTQSQNFTNAEAAFQALKDWSHVEEYIHIDGNAAFRLKKRAEREGRTDRSYSGYGSNVEAMKDVLKNKFSEPNLATQLCATKNALLIEHNDVVGRDRFWSNNHDGTGSNMLGLLLMELRDVLADTSYTQTYVHNWKTFVQEGTHQILTQIGEYSSVCLYPGCDKETWNGKKGFCSKSHRDAICKQCLSKFRYERHDFCSRTCTKEYIQHHNQ